MHLKVTNKQAHVWNRSRRLCCHKANPKSQNAVDWQDLYFYGVLLHAFFVILFVSLRYNDCTIWNHYLILSSLRYQVSTHFIQSTSIRREYAYRFVGPILKSWSWAMLKAKGKVRVLLFWLLLFLESQFGFAVRLLGHQRWNELISAYSGVSV